MPCEQALDKGKKLALKQTDIKDMKVYVTKTVKTIKAYHDKDKKYHYETIVAPPKTKNSRRIVPIPSNLKQILNELNKIRNEEKLKLGELYQDNELLFPSETGTYIDARNLTRAWKRAFKKTVSRIKNFML